VEPKITGEVEARIIALSCSTPPPGRLKWSLSPYFAGPQDRINVIINK